MKKILLTAGILLSSICVVSAQSTEVDNREKMEFGIKGGINSSNVYDEKGDDFTADNRIGFAGGVFMSLPLGKYLGIQPEIMFNQKGYEGKDTTLLGTYSYTRRTNHLDIPIQLQIKPSPYVTILGGPYVSFMLSRSDKFTSGDISVENEEEIENDNLRKNTLGVIGGLDINIRYVVISGRVAWDFQNNNGDGSSTSPRYKNVFVQGTIGFKF